MTIAGWAMFIVLGGGILIMGLLIGYESDRIRLSVGIAALLIAALYGGMRFYFQKTASGQRALVDEMSELGNGLNREINVYTAEGELIAHYDGKIDLEDNDGGYVIFDYEGKRYTYYNCFVESIAEIQ